jgi:hypothetical protein
MFRSHLEGKFQQQLSDEKQWNQSSTAGQAPVDDSNMQSDSPSKEVASDLGTMKLDAIKNTGKAMKLENDPKTDSLLPVSVTETEKIKLNNIGGF